MYSRFEEAGNISFCSAGLHPWHLQNYHQDLAVLEQTATLPNVLAIGECGLDKACDTDWELQNEAFTRQIALAKDVGKPLIIHCVRAYDEVIQMLDKHNIDMPVIFHGFNKKQTIAGKLIARGYYLSFGAALLSPRSVIDEVFSLVPADKFLLETDDSNVNISEIYDRAAGIRKTSIDAIILQVQQNFKKVFNQ